MLSTGHGCIRSQLTSPTETLAYYDKEAETTLVADASLLGLGCVLYKLKGVYLELQPVVMNDCLMLKLDILR